MTKPHYLKWKIAASLVFLALLAFVSSASATVLFSDNFATDGGANGNGNLNMNYFPAGRQAGPLSPATWYAGGDHHQIGNTGTDVGQPGGYAAYGGGYILMAGGGGNCQLDLDMATISAGTLTVDFDLMMKTNSDGGWCGFSLRHPQSAYPVAGSGEFGFLHRGNAGMQVFQNGSSGAGGTASWDTANFATSQHWTLIFSDTAGTGSAFVGNGSKVEMRNGTAWTNTLTLSQLHRSGLKLGFNCSSGSASYAGVDNLVVSGTQQAIAKTTTNESGSNPFTPTWTAETPNILTTGQLPTSSSGNFNADGGEGSLSVLTDGTIGISGTASTMVSCGANAGTSLIYTLTGSPNGYDLTNIVTYSGWANQGRFGQYYDVSYATVAAPSTFIRIGTAFYYPGITLPGTEGNIPDAPAARVQIANTNGSVMATGVGYIKFDFGAPPNAGNFNNGWQGYSEIIVQGTNTSTPPPPPSAILSQDILPAAVVTYVGDQVVFSATYSNFPPVTPQWQKITAGPVTNNINAGVNTGVVIVNSGGVTTSTLTLSNVLTTDSGTYTLEGLNATNGAAARSEEHT